MSNNRLSPENIKSRIDYIKNKKIKDLDDTINYYKECGAREDLTRYQEDKEELEQEVINLETLLSDGPKKLDTMKVKVTEYEGKIIIKTIDPEAFDQDYLGAGQGRIGCMLLDNSRLHISQEALDAIEALSKCRDAIGDFSGDAEHFSWIGGPYSIKDSSCVKSRDFRMPKGYVLIENETDQEAIDVIEDKQEGSQDIDYADVEYEIWIELSQNGGHGKEGDEPVPFRVHLNMLERNIFDNEIKILNSPEGSVILSDYGDGARKVLMPEEKKEEIKKLVDEIFTQEKKVEEVESDSMSIKELWRNLKTEGEVYEEDIMSFVNGFYDLGFFNNCLNPHKEYWRMAMKATPDVLIEKLKAFKRA